MISNELLSVVLGLHCGIKSIKNSEVIYWFDCIGEIREYSINIYELAHKCKEWALKHHYKVISKPDNVPGLWKAYVNLSLTSKHGEVADTEPEAIFKACQWILDKDSK